MRLIGLFITLLSSNCFALDLATLQQRLQAQQNFSAQLTQTKTLKGWSKALQAQGLLACTQKNGVLYYLQKPLNASYWLQSTQINVREGNTAVRVLSTAQMPWLAGITSLLSASVSGDWQRLQQQFNIKLVKAEENDWQIELTPIAEPLRQTLQTVQVSGAAQITQIVISDKKGDRTQINLQHHQSLDDEQMRALLQQAGQG